MLNNPLPSSSARQPRALVLVNGVVVRALVSFEVDNNNFYQADTFKVTLALSAQPKETNWLWWSSQKSLVVEIFAGFPKDPNNYTQSDLTSLIIGNVDDLETNPISDEIILSGRDFTSKFIDSQTSEKFPNLTSSAIIQQFAQRQGLSAQATATKTKTGTFYSLEKVSLTKRQSEWDLMTYLANKEGFSVFVRGKTVYFQPKASPSDNPYVIQYQAPNDNAGYVQLNAVSMTFSRNLTLAKDIIVIVSSFNPKTKKGFSVKRTATHNKNTVLAGAAQPTGEAQTYYRYKPGLSVQDATDYAESLLHELSLHEMKLTVDMPADNTLFVTNMVQVIGTGTAFDQFYYPDQIIRSFSWDSGFSMQVQAKNHPVESEIAG
jgi:phage protein D